MSWGERSCSKEKAPKNERGGCAVAEFATCNVDCPYYTWNGVTKPDSTPRVATRKTFELRHSIPTFSRRTYPTDLLDAAAKESAKAEAHHKKNTKGVGVGQRKSNPKKTFLNFTDK